MACSEQAGHSEPWHFFAVSSCALLPLVARKLISTEWVVVIFFFPPFSLNDVILNASCREVIFSHCLGA